MTIQQEISRINAAKKPSDIFGLDMPAEYRRLTKMLHPDVCSLPEAVPALLRVNELRAELLKGLTIKDDAGTVVYTTDKIIYTGVPDLLRKSIANYQIIKNRKKRPDSPLDQYYIPQTYDNNIDTNGSLSFPLEARAIPLKRLIDHFEGKVPQIHVNWLVGRMLEFAALMEADGLMHGGINPESVFVLPQFHGISITSFYHVTPIGEKMTTISGRYSSLYPFSLTSGRDKKAYASVDVEVIMRLACLMLGNPAGLAAGLRKTHNERMLDFYSKTHEHAVDAFFEHKELLAREFEKKFHPLDI